MKFVGTVACGIIGLGDVEIFTTCGELSCDGRSGVSSSLEEGRRTKCPLCTRNVGFQTVEEASCVVSGSFDSYIDVLDTDRLEGVNNIQVEDAMKCNFCGFSVLGTILGKTALEVKETKITHQDVCDAFEQLEGKRLLIIGWVWVKRFNEDDMAASGTVDLTVNEARQGVVHIVSLEILSDNVSLLAASFILPIVPASILPTASASIFASPSASIFASASASSVGLYNSAAIVSSRAPSSSGAAVVLLCLLVRLRFLVLLHRLVLFRRWLVVRRWAVVLRCLGVQIRCLGVQIHCLVDRCYLVERRCLIVDFR